MKLNPDCIRDILLWLEENQEMESGYDNFLTGQVSEVSSTKIAQCLPTYSAEDILYSVKQMIYSGLLNARLLTTNDAQIYLVQDITPEGHKFLGNISSDETWQKTKSTASKIGAATLDTLGKISANIVAELIKKSM